MTVILNKSIGDPLYKVLDEENVTSLPDFMQLSEVNMSNMTYKEKDAAVNETHLPLLWFERRLSRAFQAFVYHQGSDTIELCTDEKFDEFHTLLYDLNAPIVRTPNTMTNRSNTSNTAQNKDADHFRKSIKWDKSQSVFKEDKKWDKWQRSTIAMARSHNCEHIFDPLYSPGTAEEKEIFQEKQKFSYSVLEEKLQTDMGMQSTHQTY